MNETGRILKPEGKLRRGWTTGACATAATKAALTALLSGAFPDPVSIRLPRGEEPAFALACESLLPDYAEAGIVKDAGDDPDVTHGATIISRVRFGAAGSGVHFLRGEGVGLVTRPGLPVAVGEPAINPTPRAMICGVIAELCERFARPPDIEVEISVPGGEAIAEKTWNPRLGIVGGISILGTTGIVHPFSCSAWIHSIRRGIDVSRANNIRHVLGATGSTSEEAALRLYEFDPAAVLDMGDFVGGMLKYLRDHPIPRLTIAGGFAKMAKLANGALDLHSARSQVDLPWLARLAAEIGADATLAAAVADTNTALQALELAKAAGIDLALPVAEGARLAALAVLKGSPIEVEILVVSRQGEILARAGAFSG